MTGFILISVFLTSILSGVFGMAGGMVLMGALTWVLPVQQAMMLHATSQFFSNGSRAVIHRRHLHRPSLPYYLAGLAVSLTVFCLVSFIPDKIAVFLLLGGAPYFQLAIRRKVKFDFTKPGHAFFCGVIVTCFQLTAGVSGPMLDMFFQNIAMTRHQVVATKAFTQSISHVVKFIYFGLIVAAGAEALPFWIYLSVIPMAIAGNHFATYALDRITDKQFYKATQFLLLAVGAIYLGKALWLGMEGP